MQPDLSHPPSLAEWNSAADTTRVLRVAWLLEPGQPARQFARLTIQNGCLTDVSSVPADERSQVLPCALVPRLVNAHTHLEFSTLTAPLSPPDPFADWIQAVIQHRRQNPEAGAAGIRRGLTESFQHGSAVVGEITTTDDLQQYSDSGVHVLAFRELLGLLPEQIDTQLDTARRFLQQPFAAHVQPALSPHAPYSVHPDLFQATVDLAAAQQLPLAMHLAETKAELQLLHDGTGQLVDFLSSLGLWRPDVISAGTTPQRYLETLARLPRALAIHGNYFTAADCEFLSRNPQIATVYCPRTCQYFGHRDHPWQKLLAAGATVLVGTDSRASNPDLSLWKELQCLARHPNSMPMPRLLDLATINAARFLQLPLPLLRIGDAADGILIPCAADSQAQLSDRLAAAEAQPAAVLRHGQLMK